MGKRKRGPARIGHDEKPSEFEDRSVAKLKLNSYEDVEDSGDEYLRERDEILLGEPANKRNTQQHQEEDFLQHSDEEVLGYSSSSSEAGDFHDDNEDAGAGQEASGSERDDVIDDEIDEDEMAGWGGSKSAFYNTDKITNEEEALAEEQEARRLQQKRLKSLRAADFGFDEGEWATSGKDQALEDGLSGGDDEDADGGVVREKLPQLHIPPDMSDAEKLKMLRRRYPESESFAKSLVELQPVWDELKKDFDEYQQEGKPGSSDVAVRTPTSIVQFRALSAYLGALSMYFAILISPARDSTDVSIVMPMQPHDLRDHNVIEYVRQCESNWESVIDLDDSLVDEEADDTLALRDREGTGDLRLVDVATDIGADGSLKKASSGVQSQRAQQDATDARIAASQARRDARKAKIAASLEQATARLTKPASSLRKQPAALTKDANYIGDEAPLNEREAAEKAQRKKSLRFYTSRIAQKANKDARFGEGAGGDEDLPYKERFRDKVERLNKEAEARGRKVGGDKMDEEEDGSGESDQGMINADREDMNHDDDYKQLMGKVQGKKEKKQQREAAYQEAKAAGGHVERVAQREIGSDGRREIGYAIAKNKGLTPKRKKEVKNPRVKKRMRYEDKTKKLKSMKPTWKGGEGRGGYKGELTGIKTGLVKSTRL